MLRHSGCEGVIEHANGCFDRLHAACDFAPQLAIIASPAPFHLHTASVLARAGAHLLVEKPLSDRVEGVADLIELCGDLGRQLQVGYNLRFMEALQQFRTLVAEGCIGQVYKVCSDIGQFLPAWRPEVDYRATVSSQAALGGGVLLELSHELDMLRWIFGEVSWLSAWTGRQSRLEIDVEDCAMIQMGFHSGPVAQLGMDFLRRDITRTCVAFGEEGTLRWDAVSGQVARFDPKTGGWSSVQTVYGERDSSYSSQITALLSAIEAGRPGEIAAQGEDGLAVMRLVEAARTSQAQNGCRIILGGL